MKKIRRKFSKLIESRVEQKLSNIQIVSGPRQVGKTTGIEQVLDNWKHSKLYFTADNKEHDEFWIESNWEKALNLKSPTLLIFDEIQKIPNWSEVIKYNFDKIRNKIDLRIVLLGSASNLLQQGSAESLAGRYELIKVFHWGFKESKEFFNWDLDTFLKYGGYPEASKLINDEERWRSYILNSIISPCINKDILSIVAINKPALFKQTFELCMQYPAMEVSLNKLLGQLQDKGNAATIKHYLNVLENAYLIKVLDKYSGSVVKQRSSSPKIVPLCPSLITAYSGTDILDSDLSFKGRVIEAVVIAKLVRGNHKLYYWREGKDEVDIVLELNRKIYAIEVKSGRKKFTKGIKKFVEKYPNSIPVIINQYNLEDFLLDDNLFKNIENGIY